MWDDERDKEMMRNQMVAIMLMMVLLWGWYAYFVPKQAPVVEPPPESIDSQASTRTLGTPAQEALRAPAATDLGGGQGQWPGLPPLPDQLDPAADEVSISDGPLALVFTRIGGRLKEAHVLIDAEDGGSIQLVPVEPGISDVDSIYPLGLRFSDERIGDELDYRRFDAVVDASGRAVTFTLELPGAAVVRKTFRLGAGHVLAVDIEYENLEAQSRILGMDVQPAYILNWGPGIVVEGEGRSFPPNMVWRKDDGMEVFKPSDLPTSEGRPEAKRIPGVDWIAYKSKYFMTALKPAGDGARTDGWAFGSEEAFRYGLFTPRFEIQPGQAHTSSYQVYIGPMHLSALREAWPTMPDALRFFNPDGWFGKTVNNAMDSFAKMLLRNLNWWYGFVPNYGFAIIMLTVLVRMVMFPLTLKSMRSMKSMQALQPEMTALREKFKDDQQALSQATMQMYKERKVNPLAGCFPMMLQMPVFIALYRMLWNTFELRGSSFLWIDDLSQPDSLFKLPFMEGIPLLGSFFSSFNLLPILVGLSMVVSMRMTPTSGPMQNPQQKFIMNFMPIMFGAISYPFAAGLNLYILTSTVLGIVQNKLVRATDIAGPPVKTETSEPGPETEAAPEQPKAKAKAKKTTSKPSGKDSRRKKPQHFYDRAQQRKREMARAGRKKNRKK